MVTSPDFAFPVLVGAMPKLYLLFGQSAAIRPNRPETTTEFGISNEHIGYR